MSTRTDCWGCRCHWFRSFRSSKIILLNWLHVSVSISIMFSQVEKICFSPWLLICLLPPLLHTEGWRAGPADAVVDGNLLHEGVLGGHREVRGLHLTEVELHGAVVTHDMRVKMLAAQLLFSHPESFGWLSAVLGVGQNHLIGVEILEKRHSDQI